MKNSMQDLLNEMIKSQLPTINVDIQSEIKNQNLDPWEQVASGSGTLGKVDLKVATVEAKTNYNVSSLCGLSSFTVDSFVFSDLQTDQNNSSQLSGTVSMTASFSENYTANASGGISASFKNFIHNIQKKVTISGKMTVTNIRASATGVFTASSDGTKVCLTSLSLNTAELEYDSLEFKLDNLGFFQEFVDMQLNLFVSLFKDQICSSIASAVKTITNSVVSSILPQCTNL